MHFRSDEQDREDQRLRDVYERQRLNRMVANLSSSMAILRRSVLPAVICSFLFGMFAWLAMGDPEPMVRRAMLPVGMTLTVLAAGLFAYAFWARSAWRIKRDQIDYLLHGNDADYSGGERSSATFRTLGPLGSFTGIFLLFKLLLIHSVESSAASSQTDGGGGIFITLAVILGLWGIGVLLSKLSDSLPY